ncbi:MAG TPA: hypothetical protein PKA61_07640 [Nitrospira sp.]|nr:hypothetical protein [Nitrospira sp.]
MASRFYLHSSGSSVISPSFDGGWEQTGQAVRLPMDLKSMQGPLTALADSSAKTVPVTTTQQILCYQFVSNQIFLPVRLDASVLFSMVLRGLENATTNNVFLAVILRGVSAAAGAALSTLFSSMTNAGTEFVATAATRIFSQTAITSVGFSQPFRLVLEVGGHAQAPSVAGSYTYRVGTNAASDFALTSALTTDLNPWMELSANLNAVTFGNYQGVKVGNNMGTGERIR